MGRGLLCGLSTSPSARWIIEVHKLSIISPDAGDGLSTMARGDFEAPTRDHPLQTSQEAGKASGSAPESVVGRVVSPRR